MSRWTPPRWGTVVVVSRATESCNPFTLTPPPGTKREPLVWLLWDQGETSVENLHEIERSSPSLGGFGGFGGTEMTACPEPGWEGRLPQTSLMQAPPSTANAEALD